MEAELLVCVWGDSRELTFIQWGLKMLKKQKFWAVDREAFGVPRMGELVVIAVSIITLDGFLKAKC